MSIIDSVYDVVEQDFTLKEILGVTLWDKSGLYAGFVPANSQDRLPYITYQYDKTPIVNCWPYFQYSVDFDIYDRTDGNDVTRVENIANELISLLDKTEVQDQNNNPSTLFLQSDLYFQLEPGIIHRKLTFVLRAFDFDLLVVR